MQCLKYSFVESRKLNKTNVFNYSDYFNNSIMFKPTSLKQLILDNIVVSFRNNTVYYDIFGDTYTEDSFGYLTLYIDNINIIYLPDRKQITHIKMPPKHKITINKCIISYNGPLYHIKNNVFKTIAFNDFLYLGKYYDIKTYANMNNNNIYTLNNSSFHILHQKPSYITLFGIEQIPNIPITQALHDIMYSMDYNDSYDHKYDVYNRVIKLFKNLITNNRYYGFVLMIWKIKYWPLCRSEQILIDYVFGLVVSEMKYRMMHYMLFNTNITFDNLLLSKILHTFPIHKHSNVQVAHKLFCMLIDKYTPKMKMLYDIAHVYDDNKNNANDVFYLKHINKICMNIYPNVPNCYLSKCLNNIIGLKNKNDIIQFYMIDRNEQINKKRVKNLSKYLNDKPDLQKIYINKIIDVYTLHKLLIYLQIK